MAASEHRRVGLDEALEGAAAPAVYARPEAPVLRRRFGGGSRFGCESESGVDSGSAALLRQEHRRERRHERARQEVRREHREDDGEREREEEEPRGPGEKHDREEDDADRERRRERRERDLARAVEDRDEDLLALAPVAVDVLDLDGGVVDEHPDDEREPAERHQVEGLPGELERR